MKLNFVSLDIPFPPNYGGAIDIFYKIKAFHKLNCKIFLHCFYSDREKPSELEQYCEKVFYYPRNMHITKHLFSKNPFLIESRYSDILIKNLKNLNYPIFFDGLQSVAVAFHLDLYKRKKYVRIHNVESKYIRKLAQAEPSWLKKTGLLLDAYKYIGFEKTITAFDYIFTISENDKNFYKKYNNHIKKIFPFHSNQKVCSLPGKGNFILYHGNYNVSENYQSGLFLIDKIFSDCSFRLIIAGANAYKKFSSKIQRYKNIEIVNNPTIHEMNLLIQEAQINILPAFQSAGIKLKLINSLYLGRHCLVNTKMLLPCPELKKLCVVCDSVEQFKKQIISLMNTPFSKEMKQIRTNILTKNFNNVQNASQMIDLMK